MWEFLARPWPWYIAGPLIGLFVPALLLLGHALLGQPAVHRRPLPRAPVKLDVGALLGHPRRRVADSVPGLARARRAR